MKSRLAPSPSRLTIPGLAAGLMALASAATAAPLHGNVAKGRELFMARCALCHSAGDLGDPGQGPPLAGVVGRKAASVPDFGYSAALKKSGLVWTPANLDRFLAGPSKMVPGTYMPVTVSKASDRADLIAFLASVKAR